jgi:hypothetical protein
LCFIRDEDVEDFERKHPDPTLIWGYAHCRGHRGRRDQQTQRQRMIRGRGRQRSRRPQLFLGQQRSNRPLQRRHWMRSRPSARHSQNPSPKRPR